MTRQLTVTLGQAYDADGNRTQLTYPDGVHFDYAYDSLNHLQQINENGGAVGTITAKTDRATPSWAGLVTPTGIEPGKQGIEGDPRGIKMAENRQSLSR